MNTKIAKDVVALIRKESDSQLRRLRRLDDFDTARYLWETESEPFINELCLMLLVALRHHVERELLLRAARVTDEATATLTYQAYRAQLHSLRQALRSDTKKGWRQIEQRLKIRPTLETDHGLKVLRFLANEYKHSPERKPETKLLNELKLPRRNYLPLAESSCLREGLARYVGLDPHSDYRKIAAEFVRRVEAYLEEVETQPVHVAKVTGRPGGGARPSNWAC